MCTKTSNSGETLMEKHTNPVDHCSYKASFYDELATAMQTSHHNMMLKGKADISGVLF